MHTLDAAESVNRIIDFFPPHEQGQARAMLAGTLQGGRLAATRAARPTAEGRVAVCEILRMTGRAHDMIIDPDQTDRLREVIAEGEYYGMQTFDQALLEHYQAGRSRSRTPWRAASSPHDFKLLVAGEGRMATSMADLHNREHHDVAPPAGPASCRPGSGRSRSRRFRLSRAGRRVAVGRAHHGAEQRRVSSPPPGTLG